MPKATIVVPAFNVAATLPETLRALQAQIERDIEILIVDDGSHDASPQIAARFAAEDTRIRVIRQRNRGLAGARNTGIANASSDYIGFCDADDIWLPEKAATHIRHLNANPDVGISYSGSALIDEAGRPLGITQSPRLGDVTAAHVFKRNPIGNGSAAMMRRAAARAIAWRPSHETQRDWVFDETFAQSEDIECWLRLALSTDWDIAGVPGTLVHYRVNGAGLSAATDKQLASWERVVQKLTPLAPAFFAQQAPIARAYQLRYLARRAISSNDGDRARHLIRASLTSSCAPLREEPMKTLTTLAAAYALDTAIGARLIDLAKTLLRRRRAA
jgi:GT2 family glycosyltransferase